MKVYVVRPATDVFDGSGTLSRAAARSLDAIAHIVADTLRAGGDESHRAIIWRGVPFHGEHPVTETVATRATLAIIARQMLDPNSNMGGTIRSTLNCRAATFGQDGQAFICLRHEDVVPIIADASLGSITEQSDLLSGSDILDGNWPAC